jgi:heme/copper-type cytochrome/quinol oxidase subunit 2
MHNTLTVWKERQTKQQHTKSNKIKDTLSIIAIALTIAITATLSFIHTTNANKPNITDEYINYLFEADQRQEINLTQEQINNLNALDHLN